MVTITSTTGAGAEGVSLVYHLDEDVPRSGDEVVEVICGTGAAATGEELAYNTRASTIVDARTR